MQRILFLLAFLSVLGPLAAQQDEQYTQWMYTKLNLNPAYAGIAESGTFNMLVRQQWLGLEGAPSTQLITFNTPLSASGIGLGGLVSRHTIGFTERYTAEASYTYRFNLGRGGRLGIGVSTSVRLLRINYTQANPIEPVPGDEAIPAGIQSKYVPNFGAGLYYSNPKFFVGFSAPRLIENNIDLSDEQTVISREVRHLYGMAGVLFRINDKFQLQPQALLKFVKGAPFDADANLNLIFKERIYAGISYRIGGSRESGLGESASLLVGMDISEHFQFGLSYDLTMSQLRSYQSGSLEGVVRYAIGGRSQGDVILSPRDF